MSMHRGDGRPDEMDLELYLLDELDQDELRVRIEEALADGSLNEAAANIEEFAEYWRKNAPELTFGEGPGATVLPFRRRLHLPAAIIVAASLLLGLPALWLLMSGPQVKDDVRSMGAVTLRIPVLREGALEPVAPGHFAAGDRILMHPLMPRDGFATLATVQQNGEVFVLWRSDRVLKKDERLNLDEVVELDSYAGREWLVLLATRKSLSHREAQEQLNDLLPIPQNSRSTWVLEVTRGP